MSELARSPLMGVLVEPTHWRLAEAMVEGCTEFDYRAGLPHSIPDHLRESLTEWCAQLAAWDRATRPVDNPQLAGDRAPEPR